MIVMQDTQLNIGTSNVVAIAANAARKFLSIQNKHATQTLRVAFGTPVVADVTQVQTITFGSTPAAGAWAISWNGNASGSLADNISAASLQTALQLVTGLSSVTVTGSVGAGFVVTMTSVTPNVLANLPLLVISANTLTTSSVPVVVTVAITTPGQYANGIVIPAANGIVTFSGDQCPIDSINLLASGANTRAEVISG